MEYLGRDDYEAMRCNVLEKLRIERVSEKITVEEYKNWELSFILRGVYQERLRRRNRGIARGVYSRMSRRVLPELE